ncbi:hypothetical protein JTB14_025534 [Gonioctena quinquepunctata]|nr:hypothetical protein JTB14_025534 [Gonioctena quinquepunctata]
MTSQSVNRYHIKPFQCILFADDMTFNNSGSIQHNFIRRILKLPTESNFVEAPAKSVAEYLDEKVDEILKKQQEKFLEYDPKIYALSEV